MTELIQSENWLTFPSTKLAARKARAYSPAWNKHICVSAAWQPVVGPESVALSVGRVMVLSNPIVQAASPARAGVATARQAARSVVLRVIEPAHSISFEYVKTIGRLIDLLELPGGWNSYGAKPISKENVSFAVGLLARLMRQGTPAPHVVPRVGGGLQLEWHSRGVDIEIAIDSPQDVSFSAEDRRSGKELEREELDEAVVTEWIAQISE